MRESPIKKAALTLLVVAAISAPLSADAANDVYSAKGSFGYMSGSNGTLSLETWADEFATENRSNKAAESGVIINGFNNISGACWYGYASAEGVDSFKSTGPLPKHVVASGSAIMTWHDWCGSNGTFTENVTFNIDLTAMTDQVSFERATYQSGYGDFTTIHHFDNTSAPAFIGNGSYITSPAFGTVTGDNGLVGQSKTHEVQIIH